MMKVSKEELNDKQSNEQEKKVSVVLSNLLQDKEAQEGGVSRQPIPYKDRLSEFFGIHPDYFQASSLGRSLLYLPHDLPDIIRHIKKLPLFRYSVLQLARLAQAIIPELVVYIMAPIQTERTQQVQRFALDTAMLHLLVAQMFYILRRTDSSLKRPTRFLPTHFKKLFNLLRLGIAAGEQTQQELGIIAAMSAGVGLLYSHLFALIAGLINATNGNGFTRTDNPYAQLYGVIGLWILMATIPLLIYPLTKLNVIEWRAGYPPYLAAKLQSWLSKIFPSIFRFANSHPNIVTIPHLLSQALSFSLQWMLPSTAIMKMVNPQMSYRDNALFGMMIYLIGLGVISIWSIILYFTDLRYQKLLQNQNRDENFLQRQAYTELVTSGLLAVMPIYSVVTLLFLWIRNAIDGMFSSTELYVGIAVFLLVTAIAIASGYFSMLNARQNELIEAAELKRSHSEYTSQATGKTYQVREFVRDKIMRIILALDSDDGFLNSDEVEQGSFDLAVLYEWMRDPKIALYSQEKQAIKAALLERKQLIAKSANKSLLGGNSQAFYGAQDSENINILLKQVPQDLENANKPEYCSPMSILIDPKQRSEENSDAGVDPESQFDQLSSTPTSYPFEKK